MISPDDFQRQIDQAVNRWLNHKSQSDSGSTTASFSNSMPGSASTSAGSERFQREIDQAVASWSSREHERKTRQWQLKLVLKRLQSLIKAGSWVYLAIAITLWLLLYGLSEESPLAPALLYGPRWIFLIPWPLLVLGAMVWRWRLLVPLTIAAGIWVGPIWGVQVPWRTWFTYPSEASQLRLRLLTCDKGADLINLAELKRLAAERNLDVIALQNAPLSQTFLEQEFPGWSVVSSKDLVTCSRWPIRSSEVRTASTFSKNKALDCQIETPIGLMRVINLYYRRPLTLRSEASRETSDLVRSSVMPTLVVGNFNTPAESSVFRRDWSGLTSAFEDCGWGLGQNSSNSWTGLRIDHILGNRGWRFSTYEMGPGLGGNHLPILVEANWFSR